MGKQKLNKKIKFGLIISSVICSVFLFSIPTYALEEPEKPVQGDFQTNAEITNYNSQVESYNQQVDIYNSEVDKEYENELIRVENENQQIEQHNQEEIQRAKEAEEYNKQEDERVEREYQENLSAYNTEYEQYLKDKNMEDRILAAGYESVEQYNSMIDTYYNIPAQNAIDFNLQFKENPSNSSTISIEESSIKSGLTYNVNVIHRYVDATGNEVLIKTETIEVDRNDIITVSSEATVFKPTQEGYASFYRYISDDLLQGYWMQDYSAFYYNTLFVQESWNCGDCHTFSYKDGGQYDVFDDVDLEYEYSYVPLRKYKLHNTPMLPTEPIKEVPEYLNAQPNLMDLLELPIKKSYLTKLDFMHLLDEPSIVIVEQPVVEPEIIPEPTTPRTGPVILTDLSLVDTSRSTDEIEISTMDLPLSNVSGNWALVNLITVIINFILALILFITWLHNHNNEDDSVKIKHRTPLRILSLLVALGSIILFMLTENVKLPMVYIDNWTIVMVIIMIVQIVLMIFSKHKEVEKNS